jgi:hypothetical protein
MRLRQIQHILHDALPELSFDYTQLPGTTNYRVDEFREMLDAAHAIRETGMFHTEIDTILATDVIVRHAEVGFVVTGETINRVNGALNQLRSRGTILLQALDANLEPESDAAVAIRIPDASDLDAVADQLKEVKTALQQLVLNEHIGGDVRLTAFDRGSLWLEVLLGSIAAVKLLGMVLRMIGDTRVKETEIATRWEGFRTMKIKNDALTSIKDALAEELNEFKADRLRVLADSAGIPQTEHETRERVRFAATLLTDLISRGAEFVPSGTAPQDVQEEFPLPAHLTSLLKELPAPTKEIEGDH